MKTSTVTLFIVIVTNLLTWSDAWAINFPNLNNLKFTNRASCALESKKPSLSAFLFVNNMDMARGVYRLAQATGLDPKTLTNLGIERFRYTATSLVQIIHDRIVEGTLPLLPVEPSNKNSYLDYRTALKSCKLKKNCPELTKYLKSEWEIRRPLHTLSPKTFKKKSYSNSLSCHYLKKFTPLQAQLYGTKPTKEVITKIAKSFQNWEQYLGPCDEYSIQSNPKVAVFQFDILKTKKRRWNKYGMDYWNTMKLFLSWSMRYSPELKQLAGNFHNIFKGIAIEDALLLVPNGCRSITPASCDGNYLSLNTMRIFSEENFRSRALSFDILNPTGDGPTTELLNDPFTNVNNDILNLASQENASNWLDYYRDNFSKTKTVFKRNLLKSVTTLNSIKPNFYAADLSAQIKKEFKNAVVTNNKIKKEELYYLCAEYIMANDQDFGQLNKKLSLLKNKTQLSSLLGPILTSPLSSYYAFYKRLADGITNTCRSINARVVWPAEFEYDKLGFSQWYLSKVFGNKKSTSQARLITYLKTNRPIKTFKRYNQTKDVADVICANSIDCARRVLNSMVNFHHTIQYAETFWSLGQGVKSPALFNPYAERVACKVYDPWYKTKSLLFNLFFDLSTAAISGQSLGLVYARMDLTPGRVVSFDQLVNEGKITYDTNYDPSRIRAAITMDFGALTNMPCAISISRSGYNAYNYYRFAGISAAACSENRSITVNANSASDIQDPISNEIQTCGSCQINFESLTEITARIQGSTGGFFLARAVLRFFKAIIDPDNIPRSWELNLRHVSNTFKKYGEIPKFCLTDLRNGRMCKEKNRSQIWPN